MENTQLSLALVSAKVDNEKYMPENFDFQNLLQTGVTDDQYKQLLPVVKQVFLSHSANDILSLNQIFEDLQAVDTAAALTFMNLIKTPQDDWENTWLNFLQVMELLSVDFSSLRSSRETVQVKRYAGADEYPRVANLFLDADALLPDEGTPDTQDMFASRHGDLQLIARQIDYLKTFRIVGIDEKLAAYESIAQYVKSVAAVAAQFERIQKLGFTPNTPIRMLLVWLEAYTNGDPARQEQLEHEIKQILHVETPVLAELTAEMLTFGDLISTMLDAASDASPHLKTLTMSNMRNASIVTHDLDKKWRTTTFWQLFATAFDGKFADIPDDPSLTEKFHDEDEVASVDITLKSYLNELLDTMTYYTTLVKVDLAAPLRIFEIQDSFTDKQSQQIDVSVYGLASPNQYIRLRTLTLNAVKDKNDLLKEEVEVPNIVVSDVSQTIAEVPPATTDMALAQLHDLQLQLQQAKRDAEPILGSLAKAELPLQAQKNELRKSIDSLTEWESKLATASGDDITAIQDQISLLQSHIDRRNGEIAEFRSQPDIAPLVEAASVVETGITDIENQINKVINGQAELRLRDLEAGNQVVIDLWRGELRPGRNYQLLKVENVSTVDHIAGLMATLARYRLDLKTGFEGSSKDGLKLAAASAEKDGDAGVVVRITPMANQDDGIQFMQVEVFLYGAEQNVFANRIPGAEIEVAESVA